MTRRRNTGSWRRNLGRWETPGWVGLLFALSTGACTQSANNHSGREDIELVAQESLYSARDFTNQTITALCSWSRRCGLQALLPTDGACRALMGAMVNLNYSEMGDIFDPVLFRFDREASLACAEDIEAASCEGLPDVFALPSCRDALVGRLSAGACCDHRGGCGPGLICERDVASQGYRGLCSGPGRAGETCFSRLCEGNGQCSNVNGTPTCLAVGQAGFDEPCESERDCAPGLFCRAVFGPPTCLLPAEEGEHCSPPQIPCAAGLYCAGVDELRCSSSPAQEGEYCVSDRDCADGLHCSVTCTPRVKEGEPCTHTYLGEASCEENLACLWSEDGQRCFDLVEILADPERCHPDVSPCDGDLFADRCRWIETEYRCVEYLEEGDPCGDEVVDICPTMLGLVCDPQTQRCAKLPGLGEPCEGVCASMIQLYCDITADTPTCKERLPDGATCTYTSEGGATSPCGIFSFCIPDEPDAATGTCGSPVQSEEPLCQ